MSYRTDLKWMKDLGRFDETKRKLLLALSHDKYKWRTRNRLIAVTQLSEEEVDDALSNLITEGLVRPSFSKSKDIIFGLRELVG